MYKNKEMSATITMPINKDEILTKMTVNEFVDVKIIDKIVKSDVLKKQKWTQDEINLMNNTLLKLKKQVNKEGYNKLTFESKPFGRVYAKNKITLGTLYRPIRHTLCKDYYVDVDIISCQPTILNDVLCCNGIKHQKLDFYIKNREEVFEQIMSCYSCSREIAKELINALVNGGSINKWMQENNLEEKSYLKYIHELSKELIKALNIIICNNLNYIEELKAYKLKHNKQYKGDYTFMSYFLGQYEKLIIEVVVNYLKEKERIDDRNIFVYCQDGIMLLKDAYYREDFEVIEKELREKIGLNIQFKIKEMDENFTEDELKQETQEDDELFEQYKQEFEQQFFKLNNPICYVRELPDNKLQYFKPSELREYLKSSEYRFEEKKRTFFDSWTSCPRIRVKEAVVFDPSNTHDDKYYNLFRGFPFDDPDVDDLDEASSKVLELMNHLCGKDATYFLDWISRMLQNPAKKTEWAIVLYSKVGGVGKNCMTDFLVKLIGEYAGLVNNIEDITKKFNVDLCDKIFIYGDEINAAAKKVADELKKVITGKEKSMEKKGYDATKIKDHSNYLFTTNNEHCFKIEEEDRRYLMIRCTNERKTDEFYTEFYKELKDEIKMKQLFKYFKNRNVLYTLNKAPMTEYKKELIVEQKPAYIQMLYKKPTWFADRKLTSTKLYESSKDYAKKNFLTTNYTTTKCGSDLRAVLEKYRTKSSSIYYTFPDIKELRRFLYEKDPTYYRYINGFEQDDEVDFGVENDNDDNDLEAMY
jgi:hypothetical protein